MCNHFDSAYFCQLWMILKLKTIRILKYYNPCGFFKILKAVRFKFWHKKQNDRFKNYYGLHSTGYSDWRWVLLLSTNFFSNCWENGCLLAGPQAWLTTHTSCSGLTVATPWWWGTWNVTIRQWWPRTSTTSPPSLWLTLQCSTFLVGHFCFGKCEGWER